MSEKVVVTRHPALIQYLIEKGLANESVKVISHASPDDIRGKDVIGVLPLSLACLAESVTEIPLKLDESMRGKELSIDEMREIAGEPVVYKVQKNR